MTFAKKIVTSCFGILSTFALITPAFAQVNGAMINQTSDQVAVQSGVGNVSVQDNAQNAHLHQRGNGINGAAINQSSQQLAEQFGALNTNIQANEQDARVMQNSGYTYPSLPYPLYPSTGVNGAQVNQSNGQLGSQAGLGNLNIQTNDAQTLLQQF